MNAVSAGSTGAEGPENLPERFARPWAAPFLEDLSLDLLGKGVQNLRSGLYRSFYTVQNLRSGLYRPFYTV